MDLVDEQHVARLQVGQERREIAGALDHRPGGGAEAHRHLARDDLRQRRLAEAGRAGEQHVVERLAAPARRLDEDAEILAQLALADELVEAQRAEGRLARILLAPLRRDHARLAHRPSSCSPARISASIRASAPSRCAAWLTAP